MCDNLNAEINKVRDVRSQNPFLSACVPCIRLGIGAPNQPHRSPRIHHCWILRAGCQKIPRVTGVAVAWPECKKYNYIKMSQNIHRDHFKTNSFLNRWHWFLVWWLFPLFAAAAATRLIPFWFDIFCLGRLRRDGLDKFIFIGWNVTFGWLGFNLWQR